MNKFLKRTTVFLLLVSLLSALLVPAVSAVDFLPEEDGSYIYDFELDQKPELVWNSGQYHFGQTMIGHYNASWMSNFNSFYKNGVINWSYPHILVTDTTASNYGKIATAKTFNPNANSARVKSSSSLNPF